MTNSANDTDKDQANELRELFKEVTNETTFYEDENNSEVSQREIDILNLPPRKEVHTKSGPMKLTMSKPLMRFIFISLLVITIIIVALYFFDGEIMNLINKL